MYWFCCTHGDEIVSVHAVKTCKGSGGIPPFILDLDTRLVWMFSITPRLTVHIEWEAGWAPVLGQTFCRREKKFVLCRQSSPAFSVSYPSRYTDYAASAQTEITFRCYCLCSTNTKFNLAPLASCGNKTWIYGLILLTHYEVICKEQRKSNLIKQHLNPDILPLFFLQ